MTAAQLGYICRCMTTFTATGQFDPDAYRLYLQRFLEPQIGIYVASSGTGVGQALTWEELGSLYRTAVQACRGRIVVGANIPEQYTAKASIEHAALAVECGVDIVNIYGPDGRHGFRPTDAEYAAFFDMVLPTVKRDVSLCPNPTIGYVPGPRLLASIADRHSNVTTLVLTGHAVDDYFIALRDALKRDNIPIFVAEPGSLNALSLGAAGLAGNLAGVIPKTYRRYMNAFQEGRLAAAGQEYARIRRLMAFTEAWKGGVPRWVMMYLREFKQPGGTGRLPDPYVHWPETEYDRFRRGILALDIPEIMETARHAGVL